MSAAASPPPLVQDLQRPAAFGRTTDEVELIETHISWVFLAGDRVFKVKKPVRNDFLDFSTLERRRHFCEEELRLNRRFSSGVYHRVAPLGIGPDGHWCVDPPGEAREWAVEMRRLPREHMLDRRLEQGRLDEGTLRRFARRLAEFHDDAARGPEIDACARPERIEEVVLDNLRNGREDAAKALESIGGFPERFFDHAERRARRWLDRLRPVLAERVREGRIREGHGDLHVGNICFEGERFQVYDGIEFDARFRCVDVAAEVAFLAMDLIHRGQRGLAQVLTEEYASVSDDPGLEEVAALYRFHYALVRSRVAFLRARGAAPKAPDEADLREGHELLQQAVVEAGPPFLVLTCGLPASGKSWLARRIAPPLNARLLDSDVIRKRRHGLEPTERPSAQQREELYSEEATRDTYEALRRRAEPELRAGRSVLLDATFREAARRAEAIALGRDAGCAVVLVHAVAGEATTRRRLEERAQRGDDASDADLAVYRKLAAGFETPRDDEGAAVVVADEEATPPDIARSVLEAAIEALDDA